MNQQPATYSTRQPSLVEIPGDEDYIKITKKSFLINTIALGLASHVLGKFFNQQPDEVVYDMTRQAAKALTKQTQAEVEKVVSELINIDSSPTFTPPVIKLDGLVILNIFFDEFSIGDDWKQYFYVEPDTSIIRLINVEDVSWELDLRTFTFKCDRPDDFIAYEHLPNDINQWLNSSNPT